MENDVKSKNLLSEKVINVLSPQFGKNNEGYVVYKHYVFDWNDPRMA